VLHRDSSGLNAEACIYEKTRAVHQSSMNREGRSRKPQSLSFLQRQPVSLDPPPEHPGPAVLVRAPQAQPRLDRVPLAVALERDHVGNVVAQVLRASRTLATSPTSTTAS